MPPQSRGHTPEGRSFSSSTSNRPTLSSYLENLPAPGSTTSDPRTPTGRLPNGVDDRQVPTPTRLNHFEIPDEEQEGDDVTLDDDEFQTHYSRHSSPASSEGDNSETEEITSFTRPSSPADLQRVASLPPTRPQQDVNGRSHLHTSYSTTSLPRPPPPPPLYPPFYNRPPTPLPPSPSLTSLLRPASILTRSTQSTRPTTPDSSDVETPNDTEAAVFHSARRAQPLPPTHPKVPTYEYYGFVLYLGSSLAFALYLLWSYLPSPFLHGMGLRYYPNRWWSLAIPAWIVMLLVFIYVALLSYNVEYLTLGMHSVECMVDEAANVAVVDEKGRLRKGGSKKLLWEHEEEKKRREREREKGSWGRSGRKGKARKGSGGGGVGGGGDMFGPGSNKFDGFLYGAAPIPTNLNWRQTWNEGTDAVMDVPIGGVCEVLYGDG